MQRRQSSQISEVRVDGGKPGQKSLGESDGVVVIDANLHPDKLPAPDGSRPIGQGVLIFLLRPEPRSV